MNIQTEQKRVDEVVSLFFHDDLTDMVERDKEETTFFLLDEKRN
jgi:hypothetical protein